jgi:hypothetical protein
LPDPEAGAIPDFHEHQRDGARPLRRVGFAHDDHQPGEKDDANSGAIAFMSCPERPNSASSLSSLSSAVSAADNFAARQVDAVRT